jgi:hypothetical protein
MQESLYRADGIQEYRDNHDRIFGKHCNKCKLYGNCNAFGKHEVDIADKCGCYTEGE